MRDGVWHSLDSSPRDGRRREIRGATERLTTIVTPLTPMDISISLPSTWTVTPSGCPGSQGRRILAQGGPP